MNVSHSVTVCVCGRDCGTVHNLRTHILACPSARTTRKHDKCVTRGRNALYRAAQRAYESNTDIVGDFTID